MRAGWCAQVAGQRGPRALEGRTAAEVFAAEEAACLLPLPEAPFEPATLYIAIDGTGVPMVAAETEGRDGKGEHGNAQTREVKMAVAFTRATVGEECVRYFVRGTFSCPVPGVYPVSFIRAI